MSRSNRNNARLRTSAAQRLASLYGKWNRIEGVQTTGLRFSENPKRWSIEATPIYPHKGENPNADGYKPLRVEITATVPKIWAQRKTEPRRFPSTGQLFIAGISKPIPPPPGEDCTVRMIAYAAAEGESVYRLTPRWGFLFTGHGIERLCGVSSEPPGYLPHAVAAAHEDFRKHLAAKVAERLLPKQPAPNLPIGTIYRAP